MVERIRNLFKTIGGLFLIITAFALLIPSVVLYGVLLSPPFAGFFEGLSVSSDFLLDNNMLWDVPNWIWVFSIAGFYLWFYYQIKKDNI
tara:strand:- start:652 stop:918 length:267 start_codon:yes stop_codon:yes gene_type:complete